MPLGSQLSQLECWRSAREIWMDWIEEEADFASSRQTDSDAKMPAGRVKVAVLMVFWDCL